MKFLNFLFLAAIISCDKKPETFNQKSIEENCFQIVNVGKETPKKQYVEPSKEDILQNFPKTKGFPQKISDNPCFILSIKRIQIFLKIVFEH